MTSTQQKNSNISIIVPTLNEAANLPKLAPAAASVKELIVVDGGSSDDTVKTAQELGFQVREEIGPGGRGAQLNAGAAIARTPLLLFLHADTLLPPDFQNAVTRCLANPKNIVGAFSLKLDQSGLLLKGIVKSANLRSKMLHLPYGDQALFIRKEDFMTLGGFPEVPIMEDYIFIQRAKKRGGIETLPQTVSTSARRWQRLGPIRTTCINQLIILGYYLGVKPQRLASFYRKNSNND